MMSADDIKDVIERVDQYAQQARAAMQEAMPGAPLGAVRATDEDALALFQRKAFENPNFVLALPYVEGGMELLKQYEKAAGLK